MDLITQENFAETLCAFMSENDCSAKQYAKAIGCSIATVNRLLQQETRPSDDMLKQSGMLMTMGIDRYSNISSKEKEKITDQIELTTENGVSCTKIADIEGINIPSKVGG